MIDVYDLHFKKDILPLFDHLHNEFSRTALLELLSDVPVSVDEISARQEILRGFLKNKHLYSPFSYSKVEFNEVYGYIEEKRTHGLHLSGSALKMHLLFARSECNREKGGLYQVMYFLNKIHQFYFSRLRMEVFPVVFRGRVENIRRILDVLEVEKYYNTGRRRGFGILEVVRLLQKVDEKISSGEMDSFWKDFFLFEAYYSLSKGILENNLTFPVFTDGELSIDEFYHPLLKNPVRNSLEVKDAVTLITGANMSGKSTLLKSVGLCVYLAHLGLGVPAISCELPFFDVISIAIHLEDDIKNGYSHFMKEIQTLKQVVMAARQGKRCFAVFTGSFFIISTHLHELEKAAGSCVVNACYIECQLQEGVPVFTYKVRPGWSDLKIGQIIFRQEGLDELLAKG